MNIELFFHLLAAALQLFAIILALHLIPLTGNARAWLVITAAFVLIGVRGIISLLEHANVIQNGSALDSLIDIIALVTSILMVLGVYLISEIFEERQRAQRQLQEQLDELLRFQKVTVGRELRMKELMEEITALRNPLIAAPAGDLPVTSGSLEAPRDAATQHIATQRIEESQRSALLFMLEDLEVGRKKIEQAHKEWESALDVVEDPIFLHDEQFRILRCNKAYQQRAGIPFDEIIGQPYYEVFPKNHEPLPCCLRAMEKAEEKEEVILVSGASYRSRAFSILDDQGTYLYSVHTLEDITKRKQAEVEIQHVNRALSTLSAVNRNLVHATDENELLQAICQAIVEQRGYRMAWVGYVQHDESKSIKIMARAGHDEGYLDVMQLTWAEAEYGMGPSGCAVRSGATQLCQDIANDPHYQPWRDAVSQRGYAASIGLPLLNRDHTVFGILNVYAAEANAFTPNEIDLLEEMAEDMAFGVRSLHTRRERDFALVKNQEQLVQLQDSLEDTVRAIATIGEMRDPYTSGHQVRVADLAVAIAKQMGLSDEQVHGIHLAGVVHDLGKIQIPAEILSKPGKITDIEFSLIKVHPQAGYDILKGINFTWPVAQMVLQHHERMDGSGYPQGLKGEAILLEARILSVADVVEAMSSHRPYRPGLGIEVALAEITKQRGIHFDTQVVDACLALFRDQHYSFKS